MTCQVPSGQVAPAPVLNDRDCTDLLSLLLHDSLHFPVCTEVENGYPAPPATWQPPLGTSSKTWHNICKRGAPGVRARAASGTPRERVYSIQQPLNQCGYASRSRVIDCLYHHSVLTHECTTHDSSRNGRILTQPATAQRPYMLMSRQGRIGTCGGQCPFCDNKHITLAHARACSHLRMRARIHF